MPLYWRGCFSPTVLDQHLHRIKSCRLPTSRVLHSSAALSSAPDSCVAVHGHASASDITSDSSAPSAHLRNQALKHRKAWHRLLASMSFSSLTDLHFPRSRAPLTMSLRHLCRNTLPASIIKKPNCNDWQGASRPNNRNPPRAVPLMRTACIHLHVGPYCPDTMVPSMNPVIGKLHLYRIWSWELASLTPSMSLFRETCLPMF